MPPKTIRYAPDSAGTRTLRPESGTNRQGRLVDELTEQMRVMILNHELPPGTTLVQGEWAERLGVSRTPLREAFRVLEGDGLVTVSNGNRTVQVARFTAEELQDMYEIRGVIDGLAAVLLATVGLDSATDEALRALIQQMDRASDPFNSADWFSAHTDFHLLIVRECGNKRVQSTEVLIRSTCMSLHSAMVSPVEPKDDRLNRILATGRKQHNEIYQAIRDRDSVRAEELARWHIESTLKSGLIKVATED